VADIGIIKIKVSEGGAAVPFSSSGSMWHINEDVSETLVFNSALTQLIVREHFSKVSYFVKYAVRLTED
jgi:hypothetical protein